LQTERDAVVIIQVSRMEPYKGHYLHFQALHALQHVPGWVCWQVGGAQRTHEAQYLQELRDAANGLGIAERVRFLGQRSDVSRLLAAADIHCQPNIGPEPFGITFIEALYAGLPIVTTAIGGAMEIVTEGCGILVPPNDSGALANALECLIKNQDVRVRLSRGAPARAHALSDPMTQLTRLVEILNHTIRPKPAC
jgi:glycosyltransferase involved in cell wall biosynthesis